jgi:protein-S-isoprenylcysteine O-methyltransferase Ste14
MSSRTKGTLLVLGQFALIGILIGLPAGDLFWRGNPFTELVAQLCFLFGLVVMVWAGAVLGRSLTAHPMPNKRAELRTSGPYGLARHPIYTGLIAVAMGTAVGAASWQHIVIAGSLIGLLAYKARFEETLLLDRFGADYREYGRQVGRFLPWFGRFTH